MPDQSPKRGAIPSPRSALAAAVPYVSLIGAPPNLIMRPQQISMWGNDVHGDCVTAEEAFAKACNNPEIFITDAEVISWATSHGVLEGANLPEVMTWMQNDGFAESSFIYDDGPYLSVNWTDPGTLQSAISRGPVKIGVAADQIENAWHTTGGQTGWFGTGFHAEPATSEDHCVSLCGYGSISWLAGQLGVQVPAGVDGTQPGYALFTWDSIGIIDVPSMTAVTFEAWLRQPTTVTQSVAILQLFYKGADDGVWSRWRNPDGSWSGEQGLGGNLTSNITAAVVPGTQILQLFYRGADNGVWSRWRNPDGSWSAEQGLGGNLTSDIVAMQVPGTEILQLFYRGADNGVWSRWRNPDGSWSAEQGLGGVLTGDINAAVVPGTQILQLFYKGADNGVWSRWRNPDGSWSAEQGLGGVLTSDIVAAQVP